MTGPGRPSRALLLPAALLAALLLLSFVAVRWADGPTRSATRPDPPADATEPGPDAADGREGSDATAGAGPREIRGIVVDFENEDPAPGARVTVRAVPLVENADGSPDGVLPAPGGGIDDGPVLAEASTDEAGEFALRVPEPADGQGWYLAAVRGAGLAHETIAPDDPGPFRLRLCGEEPVEGRVIDLAERPVAGAEVFVYSGRADGRPVLAHATDAEGRFTVSLGHTLVLVRAEGHAVARGFVDELPDRPIVLVPEAVLGGTVVLPEGAPVAGAEVRLTGIGDNVTRFLTTAEDGRFRFDGLSPNDPVDLAARMDGLEAAETWVGPGPRDLRLELRPVGRFGSVRVAFDSPEGARLTFAWIRDPATGWAWGGDAGRDEEAGWYPRVPEGTYDVLFDWSEELRLPQRTDNVPRWQARGRIRVTEGEAAEIQVVPEERVRSFACVRVLDADGNPTSKPYLEAEPTLYPVVWAGRDRRERESPGDDGRCALPLAVAPGTEVPVTVAPCGAAGLVTTRLVTTADSPWAEPTTIRLAGGARLEIRLQGTEGWPVGLLDVDFDRFHHARAVPGEPTRFLAEVRPGVPFVLQVGLRDPDYSLPYLAKAFDGFPAGTHRLEIELPPRVSPVEVRCRVLSPRGRPLPVVSYELNHSDDVLVADSPGANWLTEGLLDLGSLPPGGYSLLLWSETFRARARRDFRVEEGPVLDLGEIRLEPAPILRGRVVDEAGRPCPGAWVNLLYRGSGGPSPDTYSDAEGSFELPVYRDGRLCIRAEDERDGLRVGLQGPGPDPTETFHLVRVWRPGEIHARVATPVRLRQAPRTTVRAEAGAEWQGGKPEFDENGRLVGVRIGDQASGVFRIRVEGYTLADEPWSAQGIAIVPPGETTEILLR